ncbi:MAG TPA: PxKF domain-containing protein [Blastocatellia bacterium]|nr:PxKF domain-containing protein [Blastocatellia bacterium]
MPTNSAPVASCQNVTVSAGSNCTAFISAAQINNGSSDPDEGDSITLSLDNQGPFSTGQHTVTLTVTDSHGVSSSCTATVTVEDDTHPTLNCPSDVVAYLPPNTTDISMAVNYSAPTASDNCSSVTPATSKASGSVFPPGVTTVNVTATDAANNQSMCSFTVSVRYNFSGFFQPVETQAVNLMTAGAAVPVKFSLSGYKGMSIMAPGYPMSQPRACDGGVTDTIEQTVTASTSSLIYDAATDTYTYVWKTDRGWRGTCRQLVVKLNDGTTHVANFQFK